MRIRIAGGFVKSLLVLLFCLLLSSSVLAIDLFSAASVETYRTDLKTTLVSPNILITAGPFELYGFYDRYLEEPQFYHGELMIAYTPFKQKPLDKFSIIAEQRWDKFADDESSIGIRLKLW